MKFSFLFLLLLYTLPGLCQPKEDATCYITFVKGDVRKPDDKPLVAGDTIVFSNVPGIKFMNDVGMANLYHPALGSFRLNKNEIIGGKSHTEGFFHFIEHLMKIKGRKISLSTRGDCLCITAESCFVADMAINDKLLLVDSLSFAADPSVYEAESAYYYLQFKRNGELIKSNGKTVNNKLKIEEGNVSIKPVHLILPDTNIYNPDTDEVSLCLLLSNDGEKMTKLIASMKIKIVEAAELQTYYKSLQDGMPGKDTREIFDVFCEDLYIYFGKPNICHVKKLINYTN